MELNAAQAEDTTARASDARILATAAAAPIPVPPVPGYKSYVAGAAGLIALVVLPALHRVWPEVPALDVTTVEAALGAVVSLGIVFHRYGVSTAAQYVLKNMLPVLLPALRALLVDVVRRELSANSAAATSAGVDVGGLEKFLQALGVNPIDPAAPSKSAKLVETITVAGRTYASADVVSAIRARAK